MMASEKYWVGNKDAGITYQDQLYFCLCDYTKEAAPLKKQDGWEIYIWDLTDTDFYKKGGLKSVKARRKDYTIGCNSYFELQVKKGNRYIDARAFDWNCE